MNIKWSQARNIRYGRNFSTALAATLLSRAERTLKHFQHDSIDLRNISAQASNIDSKAFDDGEQQALEDLAVRCTIKRKTELSTKNVNYKEQRVRAKKFYNKSGQRKQRALSRYTATNTDSGLGRTATPLASN